MKRTFFLLLLLSSFCVAQNEGYPYAGNASATGSPYPTCIVTIPFTGADRPAVWASLIGNTIQGNAYACLDARGEIASESSGVLTTSTNPFAISMDPGGQLYLPPGEIQTTVPFQMNTNQYHVHGLGDGTPAFSAFPTMIQAASGITSNLGSGTNFNPAVLAFGTVAGNMVTSSQGPYRQTCDNLTIDAAGMTIIGFSMYSGQEGTGCDHISVNNSPVTGVDWCGNYGQCGDGMMLDTFTVTHQSAFASSCVNNSTPWTVSSWSCASGTCTVNLSGGNVPLGPSYEAVISNVNAVSGVSINGTWNVGAISISNISNSGVWTDARVAGMTGLFNATNQIAISIPNNTTASCSSSCGTSPQVQLYTLDMRVDGYIGRDGIKNATIDSINCTNPTLAEQEVSGSPSIGKFSGRISGHHLEANSSNTTIGQLIGADNRIEAIEIDGTQCSTGIGTCIEIMNQWPVLGLAITNLTGLVAGRTMIADLVNGNTLSVNANNGVIGYYKIGNSGAVGDVETDANCSEMTNGWCTNGGVKSLYVNGAVVFSVGAAGNTSIPASGTASTSGLSLTGLPYRAGTGTTNYPLLYLNGGSGPSSFSGNGTWFGINAQSGFTGNLLDFHVNGGSSVANLDYQGNITLNNLNVNGTENCGTICTNVGSAGTWITGQPMTFSGFSGTSSPAFGTMFFYQMPLFFTQIIGHATMSVTASSLPVTAYVCLYTSNGGNLLWSTHFSISSTGAVTGSASQYTAIPGTYLVGFEQTGSASATFAGNAASSPLASLLNLNGSRMGTASNTISSGACPSSLGTLSAASESTPAIGFEP
jgi:hypothetical protein